MRTRQSKDLAEMTNGNERGYETASRRRWPGAEDTVSTEANIRTRAACFSSAMAVQNAELKVLLDP